MFIRQFIATSTANNGIEVTIMYKAYYSAY